MALIAGHTNGMICDENLMSSLIDNKEGGSLMVWGAFCFNGATDIAFLHDRQTTDDYQNVSKAIYIQLEI